MVNYMNKASKKIGIALSVIALLLIIIIIIQINNMGELYKERELKEVESIIKEAVITCYSIDGVYPATYESLVSKTNLSIDTDKYTILYDIFASNIMPNIGVIKN